MAPKCRGKPNPDSIGRAVVQKLEPSLEEEVAENDPETHEHFTNGALVEISSDEDGFNGAWFAATIVKPVQRTKFLIEYQSLRTDDDSAFLREEIECHHIRPYPPETAVDHFSLLQEVDALYNDGWWVGVISKVLKGSKYIVYFRGTNEEIEYNHSELRPHQDWIGGKWVMASKALRLW